MLITGPIFASFASCKYKAYLQARGETGVCSAYEQLLGDLDRNYREASLQNLRNHLEAGQVADNPESIVAAVRHGYRLITNASAMAGQFSIQFEALEMVLGNSNANVGSHQYTPLLFTHREKVTAHDKLLAAFYAFALAEVVGMPPTHSKIIHGRDRIAVKVNLLKPVGMTEVGAKARPLVDELADQVGDSSPPPLTLNDHCAVCEFRGRCRAAAIEKDDISLLRSLSAGEVEQWRKRGVFTVTQLSYTFRAKSVTGKRFGKAGRHLPALQALAVREKKVYLAKIPNLPPATTRVFLDVEGVPDRDFYYLIGVLVEADGQTRQHSFWADGPDGERNIWHNLLLLLDGIGSFTAYHYGRYERTFLDHMTGRYGVPAGLEAAANRLKSESVDVLRLISGNVYFPTFSQSLKEVGSLLGAAWSDPAASGLQSLVWRQRWEATNDAAEKGALLLYNSEDCFALRKVADTLAKLAEGAACELKVVAPDELPANPIRQFGMGNPATPEIGTIIKCAYFKYQTNKVFFRTDNSVRDSLRRKKARRRFPRVNKVIDCRAPACCPRCGSTKLHAYDTRDYSKVIFDLRFSSSGVRRWVVRYVTKRYYCGSCPCTTMSNEYPKQRIKYGHGLASWAVHAHVALRMSFADVLTEANDLFGFAFVSDILQRVKPRMAKEYGATQERMLAKLRMGHVLYVDETKVQLGPKTGYVWAFTNLQEVVYLFSASRDGVVFNRVLEGFKGVLVSDFYGVYDSASCKQQKCVVHFVRDLNDDLKQNPLDEELAELAQRFTAVFTPIIQTIDKYGLKQRHLNKHKSRANQFLKKVAARQYRSKVAVGYQRRLAKYGERIFTFLSHDGVAWNNNAAENAIKLFAGRRRVIGGSFTENGISDYLLFLSIFCTLRRKGGNFLKFLRSEEKDIDAFFGQRRRATRGKGSKG
jgi:predicted RecB family nuclease